MHTDRSFCSAGELTYLGWRALPFSFDRWAVTASRWAQTPEQASAVGTVRKPSRKKSHFPPSLAISLTCDRHPNKHPSPPAQGLSERHDVKLGSMRFGKSAAPHGHRLAGGLTLRTGFQKKCAHTDDGCIVAYVVIQRCAAASPYNPVTRHQRPRLPASQAPTSGKVTGRKDLPTLFRREEEGGGGGGRGSGSGAIHPSL